MSGPLVLSTADEWFSGFGALDPLERERILEQVRADLSGRYEVRGYLGRGAFATVWQAFDAVSREMVAVKRFDTRPRDGRSFYRELRVMFRLVHPRVVRIINLLENVGTARYLILEHCAGGSLRAALNRVGQGERCPLERATVLARQLAEGLAAAHDLGLVHRDLKPENVLFDAVDTDPFGGSAGVKLADFGLTRALQHSGLAAGPPSFSLSGSPAYMAPEQFSGSFAEASDAYALGVILYELLHGTVPFEGTPESLAYHHLRSAPTIDAGLPTAWRLLLLALLDKDPGRRPKARQVLTALPLADRPTSAARPSRPRPYVLAVLGHKGGSGRTTAALALAWCWGRSGLRVGLVDAETVPAARLIATDPAGRCPWANVQLLAGMNDVGQGSDVDLVVIDGPPLTDSTALDLLNVADGVLLVSQAEALAVRTAGVAERALARAREHRPQLEWLGVLLPVFDPGDKVQNHLRGQLQSEFGPRLLEPAVPLCAQMRDWALCSGSDLPDGPGRDAYLSLARHLAGVAGFRGREVSRA